MVVGESLQDGYGGCVVGVCPEKTQAGMLRTAGPPREHLLSLRALKGEWFWLLPGSSVSP